MGQRVHKGMERKRVSETAYAVFTCALGARAVSFRKLPSDVDRSEGSGVFFERTFVLGTYERQSRTWITHPPCRKKWRTFVPSAPAVFKYPLVTCAFDM